MSHLLEVRNLMTRFYTDDGIVHAVNNISFTLEAGESLAIVGESGSGKSVSMLSLLGLLPSPPGRVEGGEVLFQGRDLLQMSERALQKIRGKEIGVIFQDPLSSLNPVLTIGQQIGESLRRHLGLSKREAAAETVQLLGLVGIGNAEARMNSYPQQFSGGQRQRIMIAMALACKPALLIADEPTTALDVTIQAQIVDLVKSLQKQFKMSIIWITHDLGVITGLVDRVAVMYAGTLVEFASIRDLYKKSSHPYTKGLLQSLPVLSGPRKRLIPIEGAPPDLLQPLAGCPFAPRCAYKVERCDTELPPLKPVGPLHYSACWQAEALRSGELE